MISLIFYLPHPVSRILTSLRTAIAPPLLIPVVPHTYPTCMVIFRSFHVHPQSTLHGVVVVSPTFSCMMCIKVASQLDLDIRVQTSADKKYFTPNRLSSPQSRAPSQSRMLRSGYIIKWFFRKTVVLSQLRCPLRHQEACG